MTIIERNDPEVGGEKKSVRESIDPSSYLLPEAEIEEARKEWLRLIETSHTAGFGAVSPRAAVENARLAVVRHHFHRHLRGLILATLQKSDTRITTGPLSSDIRYRITTDDLNQVVAMGVIDSETARNF